MADSKKIEVAIIGAGISGLAVANGLINDPQKRYNVTVYERDTVAFDSERGGYQVRISGNGLNTLKQVSDTKTWELLRTMWSDDGAKAPSIVDPATLEVVLDLAKLKLYPQSRPIARMDLRRVFLKKPMAEGAVKFGQRLARFEYGKEGGVDLYFENGTTSYADLVVAADGSKSVITSQIGLNNRKKLKQWVLLQARGPVDQAVQDTLPKSLMQARSLIHMAGSTLSGYAAIYREGSGAEEAANTDQYAVFWSLLLPADIGERILDKANGDTDTTIELLCEHLRQDLGYTDALPNIISSVRTHLRNGFLTSSDRPSGDWRSGSPATARIIPIGDAIHPMTPGRGMGASQALVDAGALVTLLTDDTLTRESFNDTVLAKLVKTFDAEMYPRAFKMVKASENMTDLDLTRFSGRLKVHIGHVVMTVLGWGASVLEFVGLRKPDIFDYKNQGVKS